MSDEIKNKVEFFFKNFKRKIYKIGEILIEADQNPTSIFYLKSGKVKCYTISMKGEELIINIFKSESFFPMSYAINSTPNEYFYEAMTGLEVYIAPIKEVNIFVKKEPAVLYDLLSRIYSGTDGLIKRMINVIGSDAYKRLILELVIYARRFGTVSKNEIIISISEKEIAAITGLTRETISRQIKVLKSKDLVTFKRNMLVIKNIQSLENELNGSD